jgi:hypothetical protein
MGPFGQRQSDRWHRQITTIAASKSPIEGNLFADHTFPWGELQQHTNLYLKKKGKITPQERDTRLAALIEKHEEKPIAMGACAHAMSPQAVRALLRGNLNIGPGNYERLSTYLELIIISNHVNPDAVSDLEALEARALTPFLIPPDVFNSAAGQKVEAVLKLLKFGVSTNSLLHTHIIQLGRRACTMFAVQLETLKLHSMWSEAQVVTAWLSTLPESLVGSSSQNIRSEELLNESFPTWQIWASWRPDTDRLRQFRSISGNGVAALKDLIALEGPDFTGKGQGTLREGLIAQHSDSPCMPFIRWGTLQIEIQNGVLFDVIDRLLPAVEYACTLDIQYTTLLTHLCVAKPVDHRALQILEEVRGMADESISSAVLQLFTGDRESAMAELISVLCDSTFLSLREALAPNLVEQISNKAQDLQTRLKGRLQEGSPWDGLEMELRSFGEKLKKASWLWPLLDDSLQKLVKQWPSEAVMKSLHSIRVAAQTTSKVPGLLVQHIDSYCMNRLVADGSVDVPTSHLIESLIRLWQKSLDETRRELALEIAQGPGRESGFRCRCISQLPVLPDDFVRMLGQILNRFYAGDQDTTCVDFARLLASSPYRNVVSSWRTVLYRMIKHRGQALVEYTSAHLTVKPWVRWHDDIRLIFGHMKAKNPFSSPTILLPALRTRVERLGAYLSTLTRLEDTLGSGSVVQTFLMGCDGPYIEDLLDILDTFKQHDNEHRQPAMHVALSRLTRHGCNAKDIKETLKLIAGTTLDGAAAIVRISELCQRTSIQVAEAMLASWLQAYNTPRMDQRALKAVAQVLDMHLDDHGDPSAESLEKADSYFDDQVAELLAEAQRLDALRMALKAADPDGTSEVLNSLGVHEPSHLEDTLSKLPSTLVDVVEKVGDQEVEIHFPLTHLTELQRLSLGIGTAQSLLLRLVVGGAAMPPGFCMHLDNEPKSLTIADGHSPWLLFEDSTPPNSLFCHGQANRATYQLCRILWRQLRAGFKSLEETHKLLIESINNMSHNCIVCGAPHGVSLHRSTVCQIQSCRDIARSTNLEIRLPDIKHDPPVVDLLLTIVHAVATANKLDLLLPGCPITGAAPLLQLLNKLPPASDLQDSDDLSKALRALDLQCETFLTWLLNSYGGFLASATGQLRIPSLPGSHQFLLANASPAIESTFSSHLSQITTTSSTPQTRILFHGTSLDRLHAILTQGLRVCSGGPLQRHGASYGNGIYMADEPATAWGYSSAVRAADRVITDNWKGSKFRNVRVLLGCEFAGESRSVSAGIHRIEEKDRGRLMVRYVFLLPQVGRMPLSGHVTPAMGSVFDGLRRGKV